MKRGFLIYILAD